ncbi:gp53-like domain-containing protein, partial [Escherichia coli]
MHRIDTKTAQKDKFGAGKNGFTRGNPQTGTPATDLDDDYFDMLQEELCGVVEASGASLEKGRHDQLLTALSALLLSRKNPFGDIKSDGTVKTALENLGLGEAAKREVGTGVNQIPDMASFTSGPGWMKFPDGTIIQFGVSIAGPIGYPTTVNFPIPFTSGYRIATSFDSAINGATDCPAFATTPAGGGLLAFYLMSSRTGG